VIFPLLPVHAPRGFGRPALSRWSLGHSTRTTGPRLTCTGLPQPIPKACCHAATTRAETPSMRENACSASAYLCPVSRVSWPGCVFPYKQSKHKGMCDQQRRHDRSRDEERSAQRSGIERHVRHDQRKERLVSPARLQPRPEIELGDHAKGHEAHQDADHEGRLNVHDLVGRQCLPESLAWKRVTIERWRACIGTWCPRSDGH